VQNHLAQSIVLFFLAFPSGFLAILKIKKEKIVTETTCQTQTMKQNFQRAIGALPGREAFNKFPWERVAHIETKLEGRLQ